MQQVLFHLFKKKASFNRCLTDHGWKKFYKHEALSLLQSENIKIFPHFERWSFKKIQIMRLMEQKLSLTHWFGLFSCPAFLAAKDLLMQNYFFSQM